MASAELSFFYMNGEMKKTGDFDILYKETKPAVYEVLRLVHGRVLFPKEHFERLEGSLKSIGQGLPLIDGAPMTLDVFCEEVRKLAEINGVEDYNARMVITGFSGEGEEAAAPNVYVFMIPTHYPTEEMYANGVKVDLLHAVRKDPHSKIWNQELRTAADEMIKERGLFEAVLVNEKNQITEGSRSNIFFIFGNEAYTTPSEAVLLGVTRTKIFEACERAGIKINEQYTTEEEIGDFEAAFISGTSPKVLPIAAIGATPMDTKQKLLRRIMKLYDEICEESLR